MPNPENLIPFNKMSKERARAIQSKGGRTVTEQRRLAAVIRELKKRKDLTPTQIHYLAMIQSGQLNLLKDGLLADVMSNSKTQKEKLAVLDRVIKVTEPESKIDLTVNNLTITHSDFAGAYNEYKKEPTKGSNKE